MIGVPEARAGLEDRGTSAQEASPGQWFLEFDLYGPLQLFKNGIHQHSMANFLVKPTNQPTKQTSIFLVYLKQKFQKDLGRLQYRKKVLESFRWNELSRFSPFTIFPQLVASFGMSAFERQQCRACTVPDDLPTGRSTAGQGQKAHSWVRDSTSDWWRRGSEKGMWLVHQGAEIPWVTQDL